MNDDRLARLVEVELEDFDWMLAGAHAQHRGFVAAPGGIDHPAIVKIVRDMVANLHARGCRGAWMIVAGGEVVGLCSYRRPPMNGEVEIGYGIADSRRLRGYATDAVRGVVALARASGLTALVADTAKNNGASGRVLEKNGFAIVGSRIDVEDGPITTWRKTLADERVRDGSPASASE